MASEVERIPWSKFPDSQIPIEENTMSVKKKSLISGTKANRKTQSASKKTTGSPLVSNKTASKVSVD